MEFTYHKNFWVYSIHFDHFSGMKIDVWYDASQFDPNALHVRVQTENI